MKILRAKDYHRMPWKNGGGETSEIAAFPEGSDLAGFGWRISMALVASDGPFSVFPEVDRTLTILRGEGLSLSIGKDKPRLVDKASPPFSFAADIPTSSRLIAGAVTDLNVMTRRGIFSHEVRRLECFDRVELNFSAETVVIFCVDGSLSISTKKSSERLAEFDCAYLGISEPKSCMIEGPGLAYLIEINAS